MPLHATWCLLVPVFAFNIIDKECTESNKHREYPRDEDEPAL